MLLVLMLVLERRKRASRSDALNHISLVLPKAVSKQCEGQGE